MEYIIFGLLALAIWHWWYEAIFAPTLRLELRFKLFKLRDETRALKIRLAIELDDKHFHYLQDSINNAIRLLPRLDIAMLIRMSKMLHEDKEFRARVEARSKVLDDCNIPEVAEIRKRTAGLVENILSANSSAWIPYLVPIVLAIVCYQRTKKIVKSLTSMSEADLQAVAADSTLPAVPA